MLGAVAAICAGLLLAATAGARTTANVVITSTGNVGGHAKVTWTLTPGWDPNVIVVARSPAVGSDGSFFSEYVVDAGILDSGQTMWLSSNALSPGTYYVRVQAYASDFSDIEWSATAVLRIAAPAPPPPAPPAAPPEVTIAILDLMNGRAITRAHIGQLVTIDVEAKGSLGSKSDWLLRGKTCVKTRVGERCSQTGLVFNIASKHVIRHRLNTLARLDGKILARKSVPVRYQP
jgi:hypothetical protein